MAKTNNMIEVPPVQELVDRLRLQPPFDSMEPEAIDWMASRMKGTCYPAGSLILGDDEVPKSIFFVTNGNVSVNAIFQNEEKREKLAELVAGECFPIEALEHNHATNVAWRAKSETCCLEIPVEDFKALKVRSRIFSEFCRLRVDRFMHVRKKSQISSPSLGRSESLGLNMSLKNIMKKDPPTCLASSSVLMALKKMDAADSSVTVVVDEESRPVGLFTLRDVLKKVALEQQSVNMKMGDLMTENPEILSSEDYGHKAALLMAVRGFHHIPIVDGGRLVGLVSEEELFTANRTDLSHLQNQIGSAGEIKELAELTKGVQKLAHNLLMQGVASEQLTRIISTFNDHIGTRVIQLELDEGETSGIDFCWISLGSEGRHEQTLSTDQDNGIIFDNSAGNPDKVREVLLPFARRINESLDKCGFPLCKGEVMASNPKWCLSQQEWMEQFSWWMDTPAPENLLNSSIFFEFRPLFGETQLAEDLSDWLYEKAPQKGIFLHNLANDALRRQPPLGFFRDFIIPQKGRHPGMLDLKSGGITPFVDAARVFALANGINLQNTPQRLRGVAKLMNISALDVGAWIDAFYFIQMVRLRSQHELSNKNQELHNYINPYELNDLDRKFFLESLRQAKNVQRKVASVFKVGSMGI